jgi:4-hydroxyacetophenone monooxygenase
VSFLPPVRPIEADDATIRAAVADAPIGPLLPAMAQLTGDLSLLREDLRPDPNNVFDPTGGLSEAQIAEAHELAVQALIRARDAGEAAPRTLTDDELRRVMAFIVGDDAIDDYADLLREELAPDGTDLRAPAWTKADVAPDTPFRVAIVGAGMSGILAAHRLNQAGIDHVILEKNADVGGTWFENTYPGCRVDIPNNLYSYSFAQTTWPDNFSTQSVLHAYFRRCADELGVLPHIRFETEVLGARFDDATATWQVDVRPAGDAGAAVETLEVQAVISAVGQLNRPKMPAIAGLDDFSGPAFHSAAWDHDVDLRGKRVGVIGTGASAVQFIPEIAEDAAHLTIFQRTPNWFVPNPTYHDPVAPGMAWLVDHVPSFGQWYRLFLFWRLHEGLLPAAVVDPEWEPQETSVSMLNDVVRQFLGASIESQFTDDPELLAKVLPTYPPIAKRVIQESGAWAATLHRDDVALVVEPIERVTATGVVTGDGVEHPVDVLIYGTGFEASQFLTPMQVTGRDGEDLHERWKGDARAYLGITIPGFPNLFCLYGPNTNIVINGSIIYFSEREVGYLVDCIRQLLEGGHRALDVRADVHDEFNVLVDEANRNMVWGATTVNSWYKNDSGRVAQNWPFTLLDYWNRTRTADLSDYELL